MNEYTKLYTVIHLKVGGVAAFEIEIVIDGTDDVFPITANMTQSEIVKILKNHHRFNDVALNHNVARLEKAAHTVVNELSNDIQNAGILLDADYLNVCINDDIVVSRVGEPDYNGLGAVHIPKDSVLSFRIDTYPVKWGGSNYDYDVLDDFLKVR